MTYIVSSGALNSTHSLTSLTASDGIYAMCKLYSTAFIIIYFIILLFLLIFL